MTYFSNAAMVTCKKKGPCTTILGTDDLIRDHDIKKTSV